MHRNEAYKRKLKYNISFLAVDHERIILFNRFLHKCTPFLCSLYDNQLLTHLQGVFFNSRNHYLFLN